MEIPETLPVCELQKMKRGSWGAAEPSRLAWGCTCASALGAGFRSSQHGVSRPRSVVAGKVLVPDLNRLHNVADAAAFFFP